MGYPRIVGELKGLGVTVSATTVRAWLSTAGLGPVGTRGGMTWRGFIRTHRQSLLAVDFFTVETIWLRLYVLFFIELGSRRVRVAGCTPNPSAPWVVQRVRQLLRTLAERSEPMKFLIRDRDQKFTDRFDEVFRSDGIEVVRTPFRAPQANGVAERFDWPRISVRKTAVPLRGLAPQVGFEPTTLRLTGGKRNVSRSLRLLA